jgi:CheY-like chemotaxis protein
VQRGTVVPLAAKASEIGVNLAARGETVLVVEDNEDVRSVALSLLQQLGYRTIEADSAAAALAKLASNDHIHLVFSDVVLPGPNDGLALAQNISANYPEIAILLTTGYSRRLITESSYPVLRKPYDFWALDRAVREAIDKQGRLIDAGKVPSAQVSPTPTVSL